MAKGNKMMGFVHYNGTKAAFIAAGHPTTYNDAIVFIKGDASTTSCIYTHGKYFASTEEAEKYLATIPFFKGIVVNGTEYNSVNGGGYLALAAADPAVLTVNVDGKGVSFGLSSTFTSKVDSAAQSASGDTFVSASKTGTAISVSANTEGDLSTSASATKLPTAKASKDYADAVALEKYNALLGSSTDTKASKTIEGVIKYIDDKTSGIASEGVVNGLSQKVQALEEGLGNKANLTTTSKTDIVSAINELVTSVGTTANEAKITVEKETSADYAAVYVIKQNGSQVGEKINIPKDMVVSSGSYDASTKELVLVLANSTTDGKATEVRIPASGLVDTYTGGSNTQVNVSVSNNVVSATLVAGGVGTAELANGAVTNDKLDSAIQTTLGYVGSKAVSAQISDEITAYNRNLFEATLNNLATKTEAATAESNAKTYADSLFEWEELS